MSRRIFGAIVAGGGLVGGAIAWGLARRGLSVVLCDEGDQAIRPSRGNFGLVWVQGKGLGLPTYARWARRSADLWPQFAVELEGETGLDLAYHKPGGFHLCLTEAERDDKAAKLARLKAQAAPEPYDCELLDGAEMRRRVRSMGEGVVAGTFCPHDGHCNTLTLLRALHLGIQRRGGAYLPRQPVRAITRGKGDSIVVRAGDEEIEAPRLVLAAGHATRDLAAIVGVNVPIRPQRGQILVTERLPHFLDYPVEGIRQTDDGTVLMGSSREEKGLNLDTELAVAGRIAARAAVVFPHLARVRIVRVWAALRVLSPDEFPIYLSPPDWPGVFIATCHSGVSLAAVHALALAPQIAEGALTAEMAPLDLSRFVQHSEQDDARIAARAAAVD